jgi:hypothetical protein
MLYEYDDASNRKRMRIQPSGGGSNEYDVLYQYDEASRMVTVTDQMTSKTTEFSYHDIGVLESMEYPNGVTASFTLDSMNRLDVLNYRSKVPEDPAFSNMGYTYDAEGNLTQRGSGNNYDSLSFQSFGCALKQIQKVRGGSVQETISYGYDGMGAAGEGD